MPPAQIIISANTNRKPYNNILQPVLLYIIFLLMYRYVYNAPISINNIIHIITVNFNATGIAETFNQH